MKEHLKITNLMLLSLISLSANAQIGLGLNLNSILQAPSTYSSVNLCPNSIR